MFMHLTGIFIRSAAAGRNWRSRVAMHPRRRTHPWLRNLENAVPVGLLARTFMDQLSGCEIMQRLLAGLPRRDGPQHGRRIPDAAT
jgi:hypothetical protein